VPRSDRLFRLLHALRILPAPVTAAQLAEATEVSRRSIYRDIAAIIARLPQRQAREAAHAVLHVYRRERRQVPQRDLSLIRQAAWAESALDIAYCDEHGRRTERRIWPLVIAYLDDTLMVLSWCRLRMDYRKFRIDRIEAVSVTDESFRPRRASLLRDYVTAQESVGP
jgi:predicted DNA-binding transcriptional regulator YafY